MSRRLNELKRTALSMLKEERGELPEKIIDNMIDIVRAKMEAEREKRIQAARKRLETIIKQAKKEVEKRYSAKIDTLEIIKIHMKKQEYEQAATLLRGFYLTRKPRPGRRAKEAQRSERMKKAEEAVQEAVEEALQGQPIAGIFQQLADLMSISEEEARMYSLELSASFEKATGHKIMPEKAAECYLKFRNWDFRRTWLPAIVQSS